MEVKVSENKWNIKDGIQGLCNSRPSRNLMWNLLQRDLSKISPCLALDAACHSFTNRRLFGEHRYFGLDISIQRLQKGIQQFGESQDFGILGDLTLKIPDCQIFGVVVSTKTLSHILPELRPIAVQNLVNLTQPGGVLLLDVEYIQDLDYFLSFLTSAFDRVDVTFYRTQASKSFEDNGLSTDRSVKQYSRISRLTIDYELTIPNLRELHECAYLRCSNRLRTSEPASWNLRKINNSLLSASNMPTPKILVYSSCEDEQIGVLNEVAKISNSGEAVIVLPNRSMVERFKAAWEEFLSKSIPNSIRFESAEDDAAFHKAPIYWICSMDSPEKPNQKDSVELYYPKFNETERRQRLYRIRSFAENMVVFSYSKNRFGVARHPSAFLADV